MEIINSIEYICDNLIDYEYVSKKRMQCFMDDYESYKKSNMLLGYFSQLRDYSVEYTTLTEKVLSQRRDITMRYKNILTDKCSHIFKLLLVSPTKTEWYTQGINKYKKVKNYSTYYYRRSLYVALEDEIVDIQEIKKIIEAIVSLDKYYDIYDETINFFMLTSDRFEQLMKRHFVDYIYL